MALAPNFGQWHHQVLAGPLLGYLSKDILSHNDRLNFPGDPSFKILVNAWIGVLQNLVGRCD